MRTISTKNAPAPTGHYNQAVAANGFIFVSGQLPLVPGTREIPQGIKAQARQVLANVEQILLAAGSELQKVISVNVFVTDIANWPEVNTAFAEAFGAHRPARVVAVSPQLHVGLVEMQVTALA